MKGLAVRAADRFQSMEDCVGCMDNDSGEAVCPRCGRPFDLRAESQLQLTPRTILREQYLIGRALVHGGFGITYLGWDVNLESKIAIKEYMPNGVAGRASGDPMVTPFSGQAKQEYEWGLERFIEEARTLARFQNHPHIVSVITVFRENGTAYLVMEFLDGTTFEDFLKRRGGKITLENRASRHGPGDGCPPRRPSRRDPPSRHQSGQHLPRPEQLHQAPLPAGPPPVAIPPAVIPPSVRPPAAGPAMPGPLMPPLRSDLPPPAVILGPQRPTRWIVGGVLGMIAAAGITFAVIYSGDIADNTQKDQKKTQQIEKKTNPEPVKPTQTDTTPPAPKPIDTTTGPQSPPGPAPVKKVEVARNNPPHQQPPYQRPAYQQPAYQQQPPYQQQPYQRPPYQQPAQPTAPTYEQLLAQANAYLNQRNAAMAARLCEQAIATDQNRPNAYDLLARIQLYWLNDYNDASINYVNSQRRGGSATFEMFHDHGGGFATYCRGFLEVSASRVSFHSIDSNHQFSVPRSEVREAGANRFYGTMTLNNMRIFSYHIKLSSGQNYNFAVASHWGQQERAFILSTLGGH